ncbi:MAG: hypothetical protein EPN97_00135 [Alphaproteobacteria bacterium]|nr:MAG: hypothetical protein EPN97_00135 [Alphaproteobacteria bacterium]
MINRKQAIRAWQERLEEHFSFDGIVGGQLSSVMDAEKKYGEYFAETFHGQNVLMDSFQGFFIETINRVYDGIIKNGWPKNCPHYAPVFLYYITIFRSFRACENLLQHGYPLEGYAMLRNVKDRVIFLAAVAHGITDFSSIHGYESSKNKDRKEKENKRKIEERRVMGLLLRKESGLSVDVVQELDAWERLFHAEVHGSKLSYAQELGYLMAGTKVPPEPTINGESMGLYMNRVVEIAWMLTRLFPFLQPCQEAFGSKWKEKQKILDESFRFMEGGLVELEKKIGAAFITFVDKKLTFVEPFFYSERPEAK